MYDRNQFSILLEDVVDETLLLEDDDEDETLPLEDEHDQTESRPDRPTRTVQREVIIMLTANEMTANEMMAMNWILE